MYICGRVPGISQHSRFFSVSVTKYVALPLSPLQQVNKETRIKNSAHALSPRVGNMHFAPIARLLSKWLMLNEQ